MPQSKEERNQPLNSFGWGMQPMMHTPMLAIFAEMNGTLLESMATAQKDWADFLHRRIKEDVAVSRQLIQCHSLADMHQIYSQYFTKAFEQYQQQSAKVVQRGQSMAEHLGDTNENGKETGRARH
jgi:phasin protein